MLVLDHKGAEASLICGQIEETWCIWSTCLPAHVALVTFVTQSFHILLISLSGVFKEARIRESVATLLAIENENFEYHIRALDS